MSTASFFKRILGEFVHPSEEARAGRKAHRAVDLCHALLSERGEVSGAALAREVLFEYQRLPEGAFAPFFDVLASDFSPRPEDVGSAADAYCGDPSPDNLLRLQRAVEPPRQELFRRLNMAPGGTAALIALRRRLLAGLTANPRGKPSTPISRTCSGRGSTAAFSRSSASTGTRRRSCSKSSQPTRPCTRSAAGGISGGDWRPTGAASRSSIPFCRTSR